MFQENSYCSAADCQKEGGGLETEILLAHRMQTVRAGYTADCQVRYPNGHIGRRKYLLINGYENETGLITTFERRMTDGRSEGGV